MINPLLARITGRPLCAYCIYSKKIDLPILDPNFYMLWRCGLMRSYEWWCRLEVNPFIQPSGVMEYPCKCDWYSRGETINMACIDGIVCYWDKMVYPHSLKIELHPMRLNPDNETDLMAWRHEGLMKESM